MIEAPNRNILWTRVFVDELARGGLEAVCIAPGSRSTPLVIAFAEHPGIKVYSHIDERSASFFALGLALASERPVALVCSSGTAAANFYPAVIEARYSGVPLLVLTADRPPELRGSGANQTIDQIKLYGDHVLWSVDVALPEAQVPDLAIRNLRGLAARALDTALGMPKGPVHLNFPFRKPLEPILVESDRHTIKDERPAGVPFTRIVRPALLPTVAQINAIQSVVINSARRMIVCGPRCPGGAFPATVTALARQISAALLADPLSGVRYHPVGSQEAISGYDSFLKAEPKIEAPDVILHFGGAVTSQPLDDYINSGHTVIIRISDDGLWSDPTHRANQVIWADPTITCQMLLEEITAEGQRGRETEGTNSYNRAPATTSVGTPFMASAESEWMQRLHTLDAIATQVIESEAGAYFDGLVVRDVLRPLPDGANLFIANSLPVRHLDQFGLASTKAIQVFCNRGTSGIDGNVSTALGASAFTPDQPTVFLGGDLAFYHDMNGLLALKRCGLRAIFVVINNDGGGIFHRLPIADFDPPFTELFQTPHGLHFDQAAQMYGLHYDHVQDSAGLRDAFESALARWHEGQSSLIEVITDVRHDLARRKEFQTRIVEQIKADSTQSGKDAKPQRSM
jgi:2-succinyl-5-enolpyruvyl-6-hydroxy-3-cyclohexene-1-carboxylate synthase